MMEYLGDVFEKSVPGNKRKIFCKAIGDVFRGNANNPEFPQEGFLDLIYLTSRLKTREPLEALASSVGYGTISKRDSKILDSTLSVILSFPPSKEVGNTMNVLIESPNFDNGYIFTATEILIKCNPLQVAEIVQKYKPRMLKLRDESRELGGDEWNTFKSVSKQWVKALSRIKTKSSRT